MQEVLAEENEDEISVPLVPSAPQIRYNFSTSPPVLSPHFNTYNTHPQQHLTSLPLSPSICSNRPLVFRPATQSCPTPFHHDIRSSQTSSQAIRQHTLYLAVRQKLHHKPSVNKRQLYTSVKLHLPQPFVNKHQLQPSVKR